MITGTNEVEGFGVSEERGREGERERSRRSHDVKRGAAVFGIFAETVETSSNSETFSAAMRSHIVAGSTGLHGTGVSELLLAETTSMSKSMSKRKQVVKYPQTKNDDVPLESGDP